MKKEIDFKYALLLIIVAVICFMGVGFAAFTNTLTIKSSAEVTADENNFKVLFSSNSTSNSTTAITPTKNPTTLTANSATVSDLTLSNLGATFTQPGQSVTYTAYVRNTGVYDAYLKSVSVGPKTCTAKTGTTETLVTQACNGISVSVKIGNDTALTQSNSSISGHKLEKSTYETVVVTFEYKTGSAYADGDFSVVFGDITLDYSTAP